jgi:hypothetical protein
VLRIQICRKLYPFVTDSRKQKEKIRAREKTRGVKPQGYVEIDGKLAAFYSAKDARSLLVKMKEGRKPKA